MKHGSNGSYHIRANHEFNKENELGWINSAASIKTVGLNVSLISRVRSVANRKRYPVEKFPNEPLSLETTEMLQI